MDFVLAFPVEIWKQIFDELPGLTIQSLAMLHRVFYQLAQAEVWKRLILCSTTPKLHQKVKYLLKRPALGLSIRELCLSRPYDSHDLMPDMFWRFVPRRWRQDLQNYPLTHFRAIKTAHETIPFLSNVQHLEVQFNFLPTQRFELNSKNSVSYLSLWKSIGTLTSQLRSIKFLLDASQAAFVGRCLALASSVLTQVEEVQLFLNSSGPVNADDFVSLLDPVRNTVRYLTFHIDSFQVRPSTLSILGYFPQLFRLCFKAAQGRWSQRGGDPIFQSFLWLHRKTLRSFCIETSNHELIQNSLPIQTVDPLPKLTTIHLRLYGGALRRALQLSMIQDHIMPSLGSFADSLTTLSLTNMILSEVKLEDLLKNLSMSSENGMTTCLLRLRATLQCLQPRFLNLLSEYAPDLQVLDLSYQFLIDQNGNMQTSYATQEWDQILHHEYATWKLSWINVSNLRLLDGCIESVPQKAFQEFLGSLLPSIKYFGPIDWMHVDRLSGLH
ncbi:hypothetical protein BDN72DRAFT_846423 [Pluteus cervinus]|uniref:Uncharacterized protein n=1 Tax=Pluteus cervinus TaxID=181527 RepID=A0ACD3AG12_9AGAR|nr:hypothetical protein BDN72DRAFT_846423 [Pluteus cervinus]